MPVDAIRNTPTDREGNLIYREFPEVEYTGDNLLYSEINKSTVKNCVFFSIIFIIGYGNAAL